MIIHIPIVDGPAMGTLIQVKDDRYQYIVSIPQKPLTQQRKEDCGPCNPKSVLYRRYNLVVGEFIYPIFSIVSDPCGINHLYAYKLLLQYRIRPINEKLPKD